jgi:hypothetical protein
MIDVEMGSDNPRIRTDSDQAHAGYPRGRDRVHKSVTVRTTIRQVVVQIGT